MTEQVRIIRVLEYTGTREFVERSLENRAVKDSFVTSNGVIKEAILGTFPEVVGKTND